MLIVAFVPPSILCCCCCDLIGLFVNGVWDSGGWQYSVFDDSNWIRIVFAIAKAIGGDGGVFFIDFLHRQLTFCSVIDVTALHP
jgi:hypothetical protein